jgi:hypothetical protein
METFLATLHVKELREVNALSLAAGPALVGVMEERLT